MKNFYLKIFFETLPKENICLLTVAAEASLLIPRPQLDALIENYGILPIPYATSDFYKQLIFNAKQEGIVNQKEYSKRVNTQIEKKIKVFISSTFNDLKTERISVLNALHSMKNCVVNAMEMFGSRPGNTEEVSIEEVKESDIYIGIIGHRYGSGITEKEYLTAIERELPCFIYFLSPDVPVKLKHIENDPDKKKKLEDFQYRLRDNHTITQFESDQDLAMKVVIDISNYLLTN